MDRKFQWVIMHKGETPKEYELDSCLRVTPVPFILPFYNGECQMKKGEYPQKAENIGCRQEKSLLYCHSNTGSSAAFQCKTANVR